MLVERWREWIRGAVPLLSLRQACYELTYFFAISIQRAVVRLHSAAKNLANKFKRKFVSDSNRTFPKSLLSNASISIFIILNAEKGNETISLVAITTQGRGRKDCKATLLWASSDRPLAKVVTELMERAIMGSRK